MLTSHQSGPQTAAPAAPPAPRPRRDGGSQAGSVLAVGFPGPRMERVVQGLVSTGHEVRQAVPGQIGPQLQQAPPDAIVALGARQQGIEVVREVRAAPAGRALPLLVLSKDPGPSEVVDVLQHGADDCLPESADPFELAARIEAKRHRVPVPVESLLLDPRTGLYSRSHFLDELSKELGRPASGRKGGIVAVVAVAEMAALETRLGPRVRREVAERLAGVAEKIGSAWDRFGWDESGHLLILMPGVDEESARRGLQQFASAAAGTRFVVADENVRLTPAIGWQPLTAAPEDPELAVEQALDATAEALSHRDLRPVMYVPSMRGPRHRRHSGIRGVRALLNALSPLVVLLVGVGLPFLVYTQTYRLGFDLGSAMYWVVVAGLIVSALLIIVECLFSLDAPPRPSKPGQPYPPASAVIAAYLPNEAATIVDTVESFLALDYPNHLEVVLAYNTPHPLPVEDTLREMARRDPRLVLMEVQGSTSKAQNVNAAVTRVRGEFVGIFDADHHPAPDSFRRAWHWLSNGYEVVQGHCVIRNGDSSWVARMVAVEFEAIYAVSHPGRTRLYDFGVFGGSNGFWRTDALARTRMHGSMLTEDIDSTMRALKEGTRFTVDRTLVSRELAPTNLTSLWNQRSRWAQGWLQVSLKHLWQALRSPVFTRRQKLGLLVLLGWRELQPWLTLQMLPVLGYAVWKEGGPADLDWAVPICLLAMVFTLSAGVIQAAFAWRLAIPELKRRRRWFWTYMLLTTVFYTHFKNILARHAALKEALGERQWRVTPRAAAAKAGERA
ncbi:glycosyltransferase [Streptomyces physcomitrii]|nr:glycosyltransferase [Streptomyces physcomitrii]